MAPVNNPLFRPPAESESMILQVDQGCPTNRCTFCGMYKGIPYRRRPADEVGALIQREARRSPDAQRVFLADGDVMRRPFHELQAILTALGKSLRRLTRINLYANGSSIAAKSAQELVALRALRLHTLYMGLESGDEDTLQRCRKGETAMEMVQAAHVAQAAGLRMSVMVLLGLGGADHTAEHVAGTAEALNRMQPRLLSTLRVVPIEGTDLHADVIQGRFRQLTERQVVQELRQLVARLELSGTVFRANHSSNVVPIEARFPQDKGRILTELDALLVSGELDEFTPSRMPLWM